MEGDVEMAAAEEGAVVVCPISIFWRYLIFIRFPSLYHRNWYDMWFRVFEGAGWYEKEAEGDGGWGCHSSGNAGESWTRNGRRSRLPLSLLQRHTHILLMLVFLLSNLQLAYESWYVLLVYGCSFSYLILSSVSLISCKLMEDFFCQLTFKDFSFYHWSCCLWLSKRDHILYKTYDPSG